MKNPSLSLRSDLAVPDRGDDREGEEERVVHAPFLAVLDLGFSRGRFRCFLAACGVLLFHTADYGGQIRCQVNRELVFKSVSWLNVHVLCWPKSVVKGCGKTATHATFLASRVQYLIHDFETFCILYIVQDI